MGLRLALGGGMDVTSYFMGFGLIDRVDVRLVLPIFFFQAEDGIRDYKVTGVQTCALPILGQLVPEHLLPVEAARRRRARGDHLAEADPERTQPRQPDGADGIVLLVVEHLEDRKSVV